MEGVAISVFAEAVVPILLREVIEQASKFKDKASSVLRYKKDIEQLSNHLNGLQAIMKYAVPDHERLERTAHVEDPQNKALVKELYDIAQDSEDLIQDCQYEKNWWHKVLLPFTVSKRLEDLKRRIERLESNERPAIAHVPETPPGCRQIKMLSPSLSTLFDPTTGEFRRTILRMASMRRNSLGRRLQPVEAVPVGFDSLIDEAERLLIEDEETYIFGIHGMGGSGKSLLMKCAWNREGVQKEFESGLLIWVSVSTSSGQLSWLHRTIAMDIRMDFSESWPEAESRARIYRQLENQRFFMVLDGVWPNANHFLWALGVPLSSSKGSKIAVISRDREYLRTIKPDMPLIKMNHLSDQDSWTLFQSYAFGSGGSPLRPEVLQAARKTASKCQGHPLALKAYGAAMAGKREPWQWQLTDDGNGLSSSAYVDPESQVLRCLRSSYQSLSTVVKVAFLYFAAFPENHVVRTADLIDLWTAERLIRAESPSLSDACGRQLVNMMIDRCVVEGVEAGSLGRFRKCKMHPMFRRLANDMLQKEETEEGKSLFLAGEDLKQFPTKDINKYRRISLMYSAITSLPQEIKCRAVRTLILRHSKELSVIPPIFLKRLTRLRTLDFSMTGIESLPVTLGRLVRLEYLNLSRTKLRRLPQALTHLYRLASLNLFECRDLECLPIEMNQLEHLRYLNLRRCSNLKFLPYQVTKIASLQCLIMDGCYALEWKLSPHNSPNINDSHCSGLQDLQSLGDLRYLSFVCSNGAIPDGLMGNFVKMERLEISSSFSTSLPKDIQAMEFIEDLRLSRFERLLHVPKWLCSLRSLRRITLEYLKVKALPSAVFETLPLLRLLEIEHCDELTELPAEFGKADAFPALEELRVERLKALEQLPALEEGAMKMLKELRVRFCEAVARFPAGVEKLRRNTRIDIVGSHRLIASAGEKGEDRDRVAKFLDCLIY